MSVLITGVAGFIGMHTALALLKQGVTVIGVDNLNDYYSPTLKKDRLAQLQAYPEFHFHLFDLTDYQALLECFHQHTIEKVIHLAAQPGVRYSLQNPHIYIQYNIVAFLNLLEACRHHHVAHCVYASSSSVYGDTQEVPFRVSQNTDHPISLYAATKKSNELMAHSYSHLYGLRLTGLRFFTVYGPWGRPDMSPILFADAISKEKPIKVFNHGQLERDFTYIDDIVEGVVRVLDFENEKHYNLFNIGNNQPVKLMVFIETLEKLLGKTAIKEYLPMQAGDVHSTYADVSALTEAVNFLPHTPLEFGLAQFVKWYQQYYHQS